MRIAIIGGTGYTGTNIAREALRRGWEVRSLARHEPEHPLEGVEYLVGTYDDEEAVARLVDGADALIVAAVPTDADDRPVLLPKLPQLVAAATAAGARIGVIGGAGSSLLSEGGPRLLDSPDFVEEWKAGALAHADVLEWLRSQHPAGSDAVRWFYVSPAGLYGSYAPGENTGSYRTGGDVLVTKEDGSSEISGGDFALAVVDELASPKHENRRFTVGH
ncbi:NAD(P)-dependent oxidoreductase [Humibacter sp.]|jgi:putative NADH-flavin reductase|uniref:NAD(P)-dependent oxidoreductase n=1 Tax=Humibacter sp. TaxID=1940291 RepID=UPI002CD3E42C|nr:NAD(P)H-binding protein [Humibacter sp.]HVX07769.1 NAD(P)H-binding protein [Humibacter sp.]